MEILERDGPYGRRRDEVRGVPRGMEAFGPELAAEPFGEEPADPPDVEWRAPEARAALERLLAEAKRR